MENYGILIGSDLLYVHKSTEMLEINWNLPSVSQRRNCNVSVRHVVIAGAFDIRLDFKASYTLPSNAYSLQCIM